MVSSFDPLVYLYTGLKSIRGFRVDACPVYYDLPAKANSEDEFLRILNRYRPKYVVQMRPDFYEARFLDGITAKLIRAGALAEVHRAGALCVYQVIRIPNAGEAFPSTPS